MTFASRITSAAVALSLAGCATSPLGSGRNNTVNRTLVGVGAGTAIGAAAGGLSGAVIGAVAGGAVGAVTKLPRTKGRVYRRDTTGACYYLDRKGRPVYEQKVRC
jgi:hypothetical protein